MLSLFNLPEMGLIDLDKINSGFMSLSIIQISCSLPWVVPVSRLKCAALSVYNTVWSTRCLGLWLVVLRIVLIKLVYKCY